MTVVVRAGEGVRVAVAVRTAVVWLPGDAVTVETDDGARGEVSVAVVPAGPAHPDRISNAAIVTGPSIIKSFLRARTLMNSLPRFLLTSNSNMADLLHLPGGKLFPAFTGRGSSPLSGIFHITAGRSPTNDLRKKHTLVC
jgi:hypothetical protein